MAYANYENLFKRCFNEKTDVLVIGGSATGLVAATTAKSNYPDKSVTVIRKEKKS